MVGDLEGAALIKAVREKLLEEVTLGSDFHCDKEQTMSRCEEEGLSRHRNCGAPRITVENKVKVLPRALPFD